MNADQMKWLQETLKIDVRHAEVDPEATGEMGFIPQAKGEQYEGEHLKVGWRAGASEKRPDESDEAYERRQRMRESGHELTRHYTDGEREAHTMRTDEQGIVRDSEGGKATGEHIYAVDAKTGEMVVGKEGELNMRKLDAEGRPEASLTPSSSRMAGMSEALRSRGTKRQELTHHTTMLRGDDVASAGVVEFDDGKVSKISNVSGHYKPQFVHLLQVVEHLLQTGAMLDTEIVDFKGGSVETEHPKAFALHKKLQPIKAQLPADKKRIEQIVDALDKGKVEEDGIDALERERDRLMKKVDLAQKGMTALAKMGIGPRNAMDWTTKVEMAFIDKGMTGAEAVSATSEEMMVSDFVMGAGADEYLDGLAEKCREAEGKPRPAASVESYRTADASPEATDDSIAPSGYSRVGAEAPVSPPTEPHRYATGAENHEPSRGYATFNPDGPAPTPTDSESSAPSAGPYHTEAGPSADLYNNEDLDLSSAIGADDSDPAFVGDADPSGGLYNTGDADPPNLYNNSDLTLDPGDAAPEIGLTGTTASDPAASGPYNTHDPEPEELYNNVELELGGGDVDPAGAHDEPGKDGTGATDPPPRSAAKPFRDFTAKGAMLDELRDVAKERNLRLEDREDLPEGSIAEGQAPELDRDAWSREIDDISTELDDLIDDLEKEDTDLAPAAIPRPTGIDAQGYAVFESSAPDGPAAPDTSALPDETRTDPAPNPTVRDSDGYVTYTTNNPPKDRDMGGTGATPNAPLRPVGTDADGYAVFEASEPDAPDPDPTDPGDDTTDATPKQKVRSSDGYVTYTSDDASKD